MVSEVVMQVKVVRDEVVEAAMVVVVELAGLVEPVVAAVSSKVDVVAE